MTKEDFEKEKESIEQLFFDGTFKETDYFSASAGPYSSRYYAWQTVVLFKET